MMKIVLHNSMEPKKKYPPETLRASLIFVMNFEVTKAKNHWNLRHHLFEKKRIHQVLAKTKYSNGKKDSPPCNKNFMEIGSYGKGQNISLENCQSLEQKQC